VSESLLEAQLRPLVDEIVAGRMTATEAEELLVGQLGQLGDDLEQVLSWPMLRRPDQETPEGAWSYWLLSGGRGSGKTKTGAEWICDRIEADRCRAGIFVGRVPAEVRSVMIEGEALALDTPVATPDGFTAIGDLNVGDLVLGPDGRPTRVLWCSPVATGRPCYAVKLRHGPTIIADAGHKWVTASRADRRRGATGVRTTADIAADIDTPAGRQHAIALAAPLDLPDLDLPIPPYTLGYWLGDGNRRDGGITTADPEVLERIAVDGFETRRQRSSEGRAAGHFTVLGLKPLLRQVGALGSKALPPEYLRASAHQRLDLLRGLIDSDGAVTERGQVQFDNTDRRLCVIVHQLASSLGIRSGGPRLHRLAGEGHADHWRVSFTTDQPVSCIPRKLDRIRGHRSQRARHRLVESVEPVPSVPVRCIAVAADHHQYLVTDSLVPTHNSGFMACAEARGLRPRYYPSRRLIEIPGGAKIETRSAQVPDEARGGNHDTGWGDEFAAWPRRRDPMGNTAFSNLTAALRAGPDPRMILTTTPKAIPEIKEAIEDDREGGGLWVVRRMPTWANRAHLPRSFIRALLKRHGGTRLAAQEFEGLYVEDVEGALWSTAGLEFSRVLLDATIETATTAHVDLAVRRLGELGVSLTFPYVAVDPSAADEGQYDECGIALGGVGSDRRFYVVGDYSGHLSPRGWADRAIGAYHQLGALAIIAEGNKPGGALVKGIIQNIDPTIPVEIVHARQGKRARAEPVAVLWDGDDRTPPKASMVGYFPELEAELTGWDARQSKSPNRLDALAWLGTKAMEHLYYAEGAVSDSFAGVRLPL